MGQRGAAQPDGGGLELGRHETIANVTAKPLSFKGDCQAAAADLTRDMDHWFDTLKAALRSLSDVEQMIKIGGIPVMTLIVFAETGLLLGFFLPGDSMIVVAGILTIANGERPALLDPWTLFFALTIAGIAGNELGRWLGEKFGERVERWEDGRLYKRRYLAAARAYYAEKGASSLVMARFIPVIRSFVPFVAGMGKMPPRRFFLWNVVGAVVWIGSLVLLGHLIGGTPLAANLGLVTLGVIFLSFLPVLLKAGRAWLSARRETRT
jgi:membrane-associated protein